MSDSRGRQATVGHGERAHAVRTGWRLEGGRAEACHRFFPLPCQDTEKWGKGWIGRLAAKQRVNRWSNQCSGGGGACGCGIRSEFRAGNDSFPVLRDKRQVDDDR